MKVLEALKDWFSERTLRLRLRLAHSELQSAAMSLCLLREVHPDMEDEIGAILDEDLYPLIQRINALKEN